jgi:hypothetical protein
MASGDWVESTKYEVRGGPCFCSDAVVPRWMSSVLESPTQGKSHAVTVFSNLYFAPGLTPNPSPNGERSGAGVADCGIPAASRKPCIAVTGPQSLVPKRRPRLRSGTGRFSRYCPSAPLGDRAEPRSSLHTNSPVPERSRGAYFLRRITHVAPLGLFGHGRPSC